MTISDESLKALIELAEKADTAEFDIEENESGMGRLMGYRLAIYCSVDVTKKGFIEWTKHFYSTANPTTVKAMAAELLAARAFTDIIHSFACIPGAVLDTPILQKTYRDIRAKNESK